MDECPTSKPWVEYDLIGWLRVKWHLLVKFFKLTCCNEFDALSNGVSFQSGTSALMIQEHFKHGLLDRP